MMHLLSIEEAHILKKVDGHSSVAQLALALQQEPQELLEMFKALSGRGLVLLSYRENGQQRYIHSASATTGTEDGTAPVLLGSMRLAKKAVKRSELANQTSDVPRIRSNSKLSPPGNKPLGWDRLSSSQSLPQIPAAQDLAHLQDSISSVELESVLVESAENAAPASGVSASSQGSIQSIDLEAVLVESSGSSPGVSSPVESATAPLPAANPAEKPKRSRFKKVRTYQEISQINPPAVPAEPEPQAPEEEGDLDRILDQVFSEPEIEVGTSLLEVGPLEEIDPDAFQPETESVEEIPIDAVLLESSDEQPVPSQEPPAYDLELLTELIEEPAAPPPEAPAPSHRAQAVLLDDDYFDDLINNPPPEIAAFISETPETSGSPASSEILDVAELEDVVLEEVSPGHTGAPAGAAIDDALLAGLDDIADTPGQPTDPAVVIEASSENPDMSPEARMARILSQVPATDAGSPLPQHVLAALEQEFSNLSAALLQFFDTEQLPHLHAHARTALVTLHSDVAFYTEHLKKASPALSMHLLLCLSMRNEPEALELLVKHISHPEPLIQTAMLEIADVFLQNTEPMWRNTVRSRVRDLINSAQREDRERGYQWLEKSQDERWVSLALKILTEEDPYELDELERVALLTSQINPAKTLPVLEKLAQPPARFSLERPPRKHRRFAAVTALAELADPATEPILRKLLDRSQGELKDRCIEAMKNIRRQQSC